MTTQTDDPFLAGGESLPGVKFENVGDTLVGQIVAIRQAKDLDMNGVQRTWQNGDPRMVWVFDICTAADGGEADQALWVRGNIYTVTKEAIKAAGINTVGAVIKLVHSGLGTPPSRGLNAPKLFTCQAKAGPPIKPRADDFTGGGSATGDDFDSPF